MVRGRAGRPLVLPLFGTWAQNLGCCVLPSTGVRMRNQNQTEPNRFMNEERGKAECSETVGKNKQESKLMRELLKKSQPAHDRGWLPFRNKEQVEEGGPGREEHLVPLLYPTRHEPRRRRNFTWKGQHRENQWQKEVQVSMDLKARLGKHFCGRGRRTEIWQGWADYVGPNEEDHLLTLAAQRKLSVRSKEGLWKQGQKKGRQ